MVRSLILIFGIHFLSFSSLASGPRCAELFTSPVTDRLPAPLRQQIETFDPDILTRVGDSRSEKFLEDLYMELRKIEVEHLPRSVSLDSSTILHLHKNYSSLYKVPLDKAHIKQFYLNLIQSFYSRVGWQWKKDMIEKMVGEKTEGSTFLDLQSLMDSFFPYRSMGSTDIPLRSLEEFFTERTWMAYPWKEAMVILKAWNSSPSPKEGLNEFINWHETNPHLPSMSFQNLQRLAMAVGRKSSPIVCCKSSFACLSCPHNRSWLKDKAE